jgi:hypothetical protein
MKLNKFAMICLVAAVAFAPAQKVSADGGDVAAGLIGGILGGMIANSANQQPKKQKTRVQSSGLSAAQREENRQVQEALNFFGFPVGTPDGSLGPRSRAAIVQYQIYMGTPATEKLNDYEREFLITAMYRAQAGGVDISREIARNPDGIRGLLIVFRDEQAGGNTRMAGAYGGLPPEVADAVEEIAANSDVTADQLVQRSGFIQLADMNGDGRTDYLLDTSVSGSAFWCNAQSCTVRVFVTTPEGFQRNDFQAYNAVPAMFTCQRGNCTLNASSGQPLTAATPDPAPALPPVVATSAGNVALAVPGAQPVVSTPANAAPLPAIPNFIEKGGAKVELASHCNKIQLTTTQNGGFTTAETLTDANFALSEQFCLVRSITMAKSEEAVAAVPGFTPQQIADQCRDFGPSLQPLVTPLALEPRDSVLKSVSGFILTSGMDPTQIGEIAQICLGIGYAANDLNVAMGSALILSALGQAGYGEIVGFHLSHGFGIGTRPDLAFDWYEAALVAPVPAFEVSVPGRAAVMSKASLSLGGRAAAPVQQPESGGALPTFKVVSASP